MTDGAKGASGTSVGNRPRRLRRRPDFLAAAGGKRFHTERLSAQARLRAPDETRDGGPAEGLYLGFTITKRVGHATERNRIRRRLRCAAEHAAGGTLACGADVVVIARRPALSAPFQTLVADLRRALDIVTKPRPAKSAASLSDAAPGGPVRERAHVPRRGRTGKPLHTNTTTPYGSTDG